MHLSTPVWPGDRPEAQRDVRLELLTTYERLRRFADELRRVVQGELAEARVEGEVLG